MQIPDTLKEKVHQEFGDAGRAWLPTLPGIAAECRRKWGLMEGAPAPYMSMNYIEFTTTTQGEAVALKVGVPHPDLFTEMEALRLFNNGVVRVLQTDRELAAILMQRLQPGTMLWELSDDPEEARIAAGVMRALSVRPPATHSLPRVRDQVDEAFAKMRTELDPHGKLMPRDLMTAAEQILLEIETEYPEQVLLHGDLHQENILRDEHAGWLAIDPKGVIGPHCLEVGRYLNNRIPNELTESDKAEMIGARIEIFSRELGYPARHMAGAGLVDNALCRCWGLDEEGLTENWHDGLELARVLMQFL